MTRFFARAISLRVAAVGSILMLCIGVPLAADRTAPPANAGTPANKATDTDATQDLLFFALPRPMLFRLKISNGTTGFRRTWRDFVEATFRKHDLNGDGQLDEAEIEKFRTDGRGGKMNILSTLLESQRLRSEDALLDRHRAAVRCLDVSPDGLLLATGSDDGLVKLWSAANGGLLATLTGHDDSVRAVVFSPDGTWLASAGKDLIVRVWDVAARKERFALEGHDDYVTTLDFSPDGRALASSGFDGTIVVWDPATGRPLTKWDAHDEAVWSIAYSPDGKLLASGGEGEAIKLWKPRSDRPAEYAGSIKDETVWSLAFSPDGKTLAASGNGSAIRLFDVATRRRRALLEGHTSAVRSVRFSADGKTLVSAGWDKTIGIWNVATKQLEKQLSGHESQVHAAVFTRDAATVISANDDHTVRAWDVAAGAEKSAFRVGTIDARQLGLLLEEKRFPVFQMRTFLTGDLVNPVTGQNEAQQTSTMQLIARLDADVDGRISQDELSRAFHALRKLDWNDDETIQQQELFIVEKPYSSAMREESGRRFIVEPFVALPPHNRFSDELIASVVQRYVDRRAPIAEGKSAFESLGPREIAVDPQQFARADVDRDGRLNHAELKTVLEAMQPDLTLAIYMGHAQPDAQPIEVVASGGPGALGVPKRIDASTIAIQLGTTEIELAVQADAATPEETRRRYRDGFKAADVDENGYLEAADVAQNSLFMTAFAEMDVDGNAKVFENEMLEYVDERIATAAARTALSVIDQGHNLFDILDGNGDGRLGEREFDSAVKRIGLWDTDSDEHIELSEIPQQYRLVITNESPGLAGSNAGAAQARRTANAVPQADGPAWFQKMDRNRDNDVSRREFLGSADDFEKLDADDNGLIDVKEAAAYKPSAK